MNERERNTYNNKTITNNNEKTRKRKSQKLYVVCNLQSVNAADGSYRIFIWMFDVMQAYTHSSIIHSIVFPTIGFLFNCFTAFWQRHQPTQEKNQQFVVREKTTAIINSKRRKKKQRFNLIKRKSLHCMAIRLRQTERIRWVMFCVAKKRGKFSPLHSAT